MKRASNECEMSHSTCYRRQPEFELWAHCDQQQVHVELKVYEENGVIRIYENSMAESHEGKIKLKGRALFNFICQNNQYQVFPMKGGITVEIIEVSHVGARDSTTLRLWEKKMGPTSNNIMLIRLLTELGQKEIPQDTDEWEPDPISHEGPNYSFSANLDIHEKKIHTKLRLKNANGGKMREYATIFQEKKLGPDFLQAFGSLQNLFEHLREKKNYEVLEKKGTIRVVNEPSDPEELKKLHKKARSHRKYKAPPSSSPTFDSQKIKDQINGKLEEDLKKLETKIEQSLTLKIHRQLQTQTLKQAGGQMDSRGRDKGAERTDKDVKNEIEQLNEKHQSLKKEMREKIEMQMKKMWDLFVNSQKEMRENVIESIRTDRKIKHLSPPVEKSPENSELCRTSRQNSQLEEKAPNGSSLSVLTRLDWNSMEVDSASSQLRKFQIGLGNVITYKGPWEWTQLFTRTIIPHGKVTSLTFKITHSAYNAIAIGVSHRGNISEKSSLSCSNAIAYWGDREIWEGKKVKVQGGGFKSGETVTMEVDMVRGVIEWQVEGEVRGRHSSGILKDKSLHLMGYLEMYDEGDSIELLSSKTRR